MNAKHTPGPWKVQRQNPSPTTGEWMVSGAKPGYLAEVRDCGSGNVEANARLISAAPELLEALEALIEMQSRTAIPHKEIEQAFSAARLAIEKATGDQP